VVSEAGATEADCSPPDALPRSGGPPAASPQLPPAAALLAAHFSVDTSARATHGIRIALKPRVAEAAPTYVVLPSRPLAAGDALSTLEYAVVDVETTGASAGRGHRVTEVAVLRMRADGHIVDEFSTLVNPERSIPPFITALTNISWEMVAAAPRFVEISHRVREVLHGAVFVAHNAAFDWRFVNHELERSDGRALDGRMLCTVRMARRLVPEIRRRSLDALSMYFGIENGARHRAWGDARATATVLGRLLERAQDQEVHTWEQLEILLARRPRRAKRRATPTPVPDP
jgi:DNA polymerase III subunit epsilon